MIYYLTSYTQSRQQLSLILNTQWLNPKGISSSRHTFQTSDVSYKSLCFCPFIFRKKVVWSLSLPPQRLNRSTRTKPSNLYNLCRDLVLGYLPVRWFNTETLKKAWKVLSVSGLKHCCDVIKTKSFLRGSSLGFTVGPDCWQPDEDVLFCPSDYLTPPLLWDVRVFGGVLLVWLMVGVRGGD